MWLWPHPSVDSHSRVWCSRTCLLSGYYRGRWYLLHIWRISCYRFRLWGTLPGSPHSVFSSVIASGNRWGTLGNYRRAYIIIISRLNIYIYTLRVHPVPSIIVSIGRKLSFFWSGPEIIFPSLKVSSRGGTGWTGELGSPDTFLRFPIGSRQFFPGLFRPLLVLIDLGFQVPLFSVPVVLLPWILCTSTFGFICVCLCLSCLCWGIQWHIPPHDLCAPMPAFHFFRSWSLSTWWISSPPCPMRRSCSRPLGSVRRS